MRGNAPKDKILRDLKCDVGNGVQVEFIGLLLYEHSTADSSSFAPDGAKRFCENLHSHKHLNRS